MKRQPKISSLVQSLDLDELESDSPSEAERNTSTRASSTPLGIPDKRYFRIGEVAELLGVKPHVLRYWESEFKQLRPIKSRHGQRLYQQKDVKLVLTIQELLRGDRYTIAGARERLDELAGGGKTAVASDMIPRLGNQRLKRVAEELEDLVLLLDRREADLRARRAKEDG